MMDMYHGREGHEGRLEGPSGKEEQNRAFWGDGKCTPLKEGKSDTELVEVYEYDKTHRNAAALKLREYISAIFEICT